MLNDGHIRASEPMCVFPMSGGAFPMPISIDIDRSKASSLETREWYLCGAVSSGERVREIPIGQGRFVAGRDSSCDLRLSWRTVSGLHAQFVTIADALFLRDMQSKNGTFVNGRRIDSDTPLHEGDVVHLGGVEFRIQCRVEEVALGTMDWSPLDLTSRLTGFDSLVHGTGLVPFYQPIVTLQNASTVAYEVLARSSHPEFPTPYEMFETAEHLGRERDLSEACRTIGALQGQGLPGGRRLFLNTHAVEQEGNELFESLEQLRGTIPDQPLCLEIHETAVTDLHNMAELRSRLIDLDIHLAYDDFGAGQARMLDLVEVPPDVLKFDISLVRNIHKASIKRRQMVLTLVSMVREFGIAPLAEGVESKDEADACLDLGFEFAQGYHFGRPLSADDWRTATTGSDS